MFVCALDAQSQLLPGAREILSSLLYKVLWIELTKNTELFKYWTIMSVQKLKAVSLALSIAKNHQQQTAHLPLVTCLFPQSKVITGILMLDGTGRCLDYKIHLRTSICNQVAISGRQKLCVAENLMSPKDSSGYRDRPSWMLIDANLPHHEKHFHYFISAGRLVSALQFSEE